MKRLLLVLVLLIPGCRIQFGLSYEDPNIEPLKKVPWSLDWEKEDEEEEDLFFNFDDEEELDDE